MKLLTDVLSVAPLAICKGTLVLIPICLAPSKVIIPVFAMLIPPVATNGLIHSGPAVKLEVELYSSEAAAP